MKTGKKIAVGLAAALVVAIFAGGAVSMVGAQLPINYNVTVSGIDVSIVVDDTSFGAMLPGAAKTLTPSFKLTNDGNLDARVDAAFTTHGGAIYGFEDTSVGSVIPAKQLRINAIALNDDGSNERIPDAEANVTTEYNTELDVPPEQETGDYTGTVELTISPIVPT